MNCPVRALGTSVLGPLGPAPGLTGSPVSGDATTVGVGITFLWRWSLRPVIQAWMELLVSGVGLFSSSALFGVVPFNTPLGVGLGLTATWLLLAHSSV